MYRSFNVHLFSVKYDLFFVNIMAIFVSTNNSPLHTFFSSNKVFYKLRLIIIYPVLLCGALNLYGQTGVADSLIAALEQRPIQDTISAKTMINIANNLIWSSTEDALQYAENALALSNSLGWQRGTAYALRQVGNVYYRMSDYLRALDTYHEALKVSEEMENDQLTSSLYNNIANIFSELAQYDQALEYYEAYAEISEEKAAKVIGLTNIGILYTDIDQPQKGVDYLTKALEMAEKEKFENFVSVILFNLGLTYQAMDEHEEAGNHYRQAASLAAELGNKNAEASALNGISQILIRQSKYEEAETNSKQALTLAKELNSLERQKDVWKTLSELYETTGRPEEAFTAYKTYISLSDSVESEDNKAEAMKKKMTYLREKNEAIAAAELSRERLIRWFTILGSVLAAIAGLVAYILYKKRRDAMAREQLADFRTKVAETELKALLSQMNPHFIFNALNSINDYIANHDTQTATDYLARFAKLMRMILESSEKREISLKDDIHVMETYIYLENLRLGQKLSYTIDVDPAIDMDNTMVPPLIMQPFVENSIWHGISQKDQPGELRLEIKQMEGGILYAVEDNGIGRKNKVNGYEGNEGSMGIKLSQSRVEVLNQIKGTEGDVRLIDKEEGVRVEVRLPLVLAF